VRQCAETHRIRRRNVLLAQAGAALWRRLSTDVAGLVDPDGISFGTPMIVCVLNTVPGARSKKGIPAQCSPCKACLPVSSTIAGSQHPVAGAVGHRSAAAEIIEETAFALAEFGR